MRRQFPVRVLLVRRAAFSLCTATVATAVAAADAYVACYVHQRRVVR